MSKTAIFVQSPFQTLCAIEALSYFKDDDYVFYVLDSDNGTSKVGNLLKLYGYEYRVLPFSTTYKTLHYIYVNRKRLCKYSHIFIGDYYSYNQYLYATFLADCHCQYVYLDDGTSTLSLLPETNRGRAISHSFRSIAYNFLDFICWVKKGNFIFYSIFDIDGKISFPVIKNTFSLLNKNQSRKNTDGAYIIGTNSSAIPFGKYQYPFILNCLLSSSLIRDCGDVFYCAHRRDLNDYTAILREQNVRNFDTEISVEVDFVTKNIYPKIIIGFASTALFTLKRIFPRARVISVSFDVADELIEKSIRTIEVEYLKNNIEIVSVECLNL